MNKEDKRIVLWYNSKEHDEITEELVNKKRIYNEKQNYPEIIVEDIMRVIIPLTRSTLSKKDQEEVEEEIRNQIYAILLKRGVNKWLFVRKLLIRLKKTYQSKIRETARILQEDKERYQSKSISPLYDTLSNKEYWKLKGELKAYSKIREELLLLCNTPRWVIWNWKKVGLIDMTGLQRSKARRWKELFEDLTRRSSKK